MKLSDGNISQEDSCYTDILFIQTKMLTHEEPKITNVYTKNLIILQVPIHFNISPAPVIREGLLKKLTAGILGCFGMSLE